MFTLLLAISSKIIKEAVARIPDNEALGEKLVEVCLLILRKAVASTETTMDDELLAVVEKALAAKEETPAE